MAVITYEGIQTLKRLRWEAGESSCQNRLSQFNLAFKYYLKEHGSYPPLYLLDKKGKPIHSWRILILKYFDEGKDYYNQYDFSEPWNGPRNSALACKTPWYIEGIFKCPNDPGLNGWTSYVAIDYITDEGNQPNDVMVVGSRRDSAKIALIEVHESGIHWTEPREFFWKHASSVLMQSSKDRPINFLTEDGTIGKIFQGSIIFNGSEESLRRKWIFP